MGDSGYTTGDLPFENSVAANYRALNVGNTPLPSKLGHNKTSNPVFQRRGTCTLSLEFLPHSSMTGISDRQFSVFPNEIFNNIIQLLPWGRATLLQCCHVNSTFYALISNPVLYSSLYLNEDSRHNILFDTLSNRPIYGTYVDHLVLYITYPVNPRLATSLALMTNIKHLRIEGQMGEDRFLWEGITFPVAEALMSVVFPNISNLDLVLVLDVPFFSLLSMCHRLQGLYIVYCTSGTEHQATFPSVPQPRHQLRSLKMRSHRPEYPEESPHFRPLISFLHAFNVQWEQFKVDELIWEPGDDHVPTLSMMNALMLGSSAEALKKLELGRDPWRQLSTLLPG